MVRKHREIIHLKANYFSRFSLKILDIKLESVFTTLTNKQEARMITANVYIPATSVRLLSMGFGSVFEGVHV